MIERLRSSGYRSDEKGFFSWLGVTNYLTQEATFATLGMVASMTAGTEIIFQYLLPAALLDDEDRQIQELFANRGAVRGEPLVTTFEPAELAEQVRKLGFAQVWALAPEEANARYFANRSDGLRARADHYMGARV